MSRRFKTVRIITQIFRGKWDGFKKAVREMPDSELEESLQNLDEAFKKRERAAQSPILQGQYMILVEERTRREG